MTPISDCLDDEGWAAIRARVSGGRDLTDWARASGALKRARRIADGATLLRLALAYGACGKSLKQCCLWAAERGLADLSDEALLKRLRQAAGWLGEIATAMLAGPADATGPNATTRRVCLVDGTTLSAPGALAPTWRLVAAFDVERQRAIDLRLMSATLGEHLDGGALPPDALVVADRGFARPEDLAGVVDEGRHFLVRLGRRSLRLLDAQGRPLNCEELLAAASANGRLDRPVWIGHGRRAGWKPVPARLIVLPLPPDMAQANRRKLTRAGQREGYTPSATAYAAAEWMMLLTSLPGEAIDADAVGALYRLRWQIELFFKRLKSLAHLNRLPAKAPDLAKAWIYANLIVALLAEDLASQVLDSPPSGPARPAT